MFWVALSLGVRWATLKVYQAVNTQKLKSKSVITKNTQKLKSKSVITKNTQKLKSERLPALEHLDLK